MVQRSVPQKKLDERAFPIRILFYEKDIAGSPYGGIQQWLFANMQRADYAEHGGPDRHDKKVAFYFRTVEDARRLREAVADIPLADGTTSDSYNSPYVTAGRRRQAVSTHPETGARSHGTD